MVRMPSASSTRSASRSGATGMPSSLHQIVLRHEGACREPAVEQGFEDARVGEVAEPAAVAQLPVHLAEL